MLRPKNINACNAWKNCFSRSNHEKMKSDMELINQIEAYLRGELSVDEEAAFEKLMKLEEELGA